MRNDPDAGKGLSLGFGQAGSKDLTLPRCVRLEVPPHVEVFDDDEIPRLGQPDAGSRMRRRQEPQQDLGWNDSTRVLTRHIPPTVDRFVQVHVQGTGR